MRRTRTLTSAIRGGTSPFEIGAGIGRGAPRFPTSCGRGSKASWRTGLGRIGSATGRQDVGAPDCGKAASVALSENGKWD